LSIAQLTARDTNFMNSCSVGSEPTTSNPFTSYPYHSDQSPPTTTNIGVSRAITIGTRANTRVTKQKESSAASASFLCVFVFSTVYIVSMANLLQPGSYRKSPNFWLHSEVLIITESSSPSAVRMARLALIISALSASLSVKFVWGGASSKYIILFWSSEV